MMKKSLLIALAIIPLAVLAGQANDDHLAQNGLHLKPGDLPALNSQMRDVSSNIVLMKDRQTSFRLAHSAADKPAMDAPSDKDSGTDLDLRYVDWDKAKADAKGPSAKNGKNGDNGNGDKDENGEEENGEDEEEEKEEAGEGWDRLWDAPKQG